MRILARVVLAVLVANAGSTLPAFGAMERYDVDPDHSTLEFSVAHMVVSKTTGRFTDYAGFIEMDPEAQKANTIEAVIKTASITTNHAKRDTHLRGPEFFNVDQHPTMIYKMKSYQKTGEDYTVVDDLTILGVTKEIVLVGRFNGVTKDPWGNERAGFTAAGKLNRKNFGMNWSKTLDNGGLVVGNEVGIRLEIEAIKAKK